MSILSKLFGKKQYNIIPTTRSPKEQELYEKLIACALENLKAQKYDAVGHLCGAISKLK